MASVFFVIIFFILLALVKRAYFIELVHTYISITNSNCLDQGLNALRSPLCDAKLNCEAITDI